MILGVSIVAVLVMVLGGVIVLGAVLGSGRNLYEWSDLVDEAPAHGIDRPMLSWADAHPDARALIEGTDRG